MKKGHLGVAAGVKGEYYDNYKALTSLLAFLEVLSVKKNIVDSGEMAPLVKCWLCKLGDLSSNPRTHFKQDLGADTCEPRGEARHL